MPIISETNIYYNLYIWYTLEFTANYLLYKCRYYIIKKGAIAAELIIVNKYVEKKIPYEILIISIIPSYEKIELGFINIRDASTNKKYF